MLLILLVFIFAFDNSRARKNHHYLPPVPETNQGEGVGGLDGDKLQIIQAMWHLPLQHIQQQNGAGVPVRLLIDGIEAGEGARLDLYLIAAFGELAQLLA